MSHFEAHAWVPRAAGRRRRGGVGAADISHPRRDPCAPPQGLRVSGTEQPTEQASPPPPQHSEQESAWLIVSLFCRCIAAPETKTVTFFQDQEFTEQKC